jgi:hypothetical protein
MASDVLNPAPSRCRNLRLSCGMTRIVALILALGVAAMAATVLGAIAHYDLGITRGDIRIDAIAGAAFIALGLAGDTLLKRNK